MYDNIDGNASFQYKVWRGQARPALAPPSGTQVASHSFEYRATWPAAGARARPGHQLAGRKGCVSCIWILDKCDIACDIASLRYLSDISCDIFFIAFAISFISYAITNNIAYDIALRYRMRYPYDAISFISHAISH